MGAIDDTHSKGEAAGKKFMTAQQVQLLAADLRVSLQAPHLCSHH